MSTWPTISITKSSGLRIPTDSSVPWSFFFHLFVPKSWHLSQLLQQRHLSHPSFLTLGSCSTSPITIRECRPPVAWHPFFASCASLLHLKLDLTGPETDVDGPIQLLNIFPPNQISILWIYIRIPNVAVGFLKKMLETARAEKARSVLLVCYDQGVTERVGLGVKISWKTKFGKSWTVEELMLKLSILRTGDWYQKWYWWNMISRTDRRISRV